MPCALRDRHIAVYNRPLVIAALKKIPHLFHVSESRYKDLEFVYVYSFGDNLKYRVTLWLNSYGEASIYHAHFVKKDNGDWTGEGLGTIPFEHAAEAARKFAAIEKKILKALAQEVSFDELD